MPGETGENEDYFWDNLYEDWIQEGKRFVGSDDMEIGSFGVRTNNIRVAVDLMEDELIAHLEQILRLIDDSPDQAKYLINKMIASTIQSADNEVNPGQEIHYIQETDKQ